MPPRSHLRLNDPINVHEEEESDITDSFRSASLSTALSTGLTFGSPRLDGRSRPPSSTLLLYHSSLNSARGNDNVFPNSPSSPDVSTFPPSATRARGLSRSNTLPTIHRPERKARHWNPEIDDLPVDPELAVKMHRWILGIALVDFDVDLGPVINGIIPALELSSAEAENMSVAFAAFPDSVQFDQGSQVHSFRCREDAGETQGDGFMYAFSYFTQRRDLKSKRGYQQRSVVILTHHPYPALFSSLASTLGPLVQKHGVPMLEAACHNIATWPDPTPGSTIELGFLGAVVPTQLADGPDSQQFATASVENINYVLASAAPTYPPQILLFEAALANMWSIWECLVLGEPILVFGASAADTSQAIWWLRDLLRPIPLTADVRPYFTIHDRDYGELINRRPPKAGLLLGVTNPFFERACLHWPHVLSLGRRRIPTSAKDSSTVAAGPAPGWTTKTHRRYVSKDRPLLKQLEQSFRGSDLARTDASLALRRHFSARTTALLVPLTRYLNTLIPLPSEVHNSSSSSVHLNRLVDSPSLPAPAGRRLKPFNNAHFFASLKAHGSPLPFRSSGKRTEFYERWVKTPAFGLWLAGQEEVVRAVLASS